LSGLKSASPSFIEHATWLSLRSSLAACVFENHHVVGLSCSCQIASGQRWPNVDDLGRLGARRLGFGSRRRGAAGMTEFQNLLSVMKTLGPSRRCKEAAQEQLRPSDRKIRILAHVIGWLASSLY